MTHPATHSRRTFLAATAAAAASPFVPYTFTANAQQKARPRSKNDRPRVGSIGMLAPTGSSCR